MTGKHFRVFVLFSCHNVLSFQQQSPTTLAVEPTTCSWTYQIPLNTKVSAWPELKLILRESSHELSLIIVLRGLKWTSLSLLVELAFGMENFKWCFISVIFKFLFKIFSGTSDFKKMITFYLFIGQCKTGNLIWHSIKLFEKHHRSYLGLKFEKAMSPNTLTSLD